MRKMIEIDLEFMNYIAKPPSSPEQLYNNACSNDAVTIQSWRPTWIENVRKNHKTVGSFKKNHVGKYFNDNRLKPAIIAGSGPSLKTNIEDLKNHGDIPIISCLHNFHYMEDNGIKPKLYVSLDAGDVTLEEISEGGKNSHEYYIKKSKNHTLACFIGTSPKLIESWKGEIVWFNAPIPDPQVKNEFDKIEKFDVYVGNGGNVLGGCLYIAKAIMGSNPISFVGSDFCFSYTKTFHPWVSKYDGKLGNAIRAVDVFGNKVLTWQSYYNFKCWFDYITLKVPGLYINCSEGGCLGAYPEGNIQSIMQLDLKTFLTMYNMNEVIAEQCKNPESGPDPKTGQIKLLF